MLPEINLDNMGFEDIVKKARSQIAEIYPDWTDYNYHDPGITILEMFAFLKEAQQFYIDQTSDDIRKKFLQFMGTSLAKRHPASTTIRIYTENPITILSGTKFYINDLCFETINRENIPGEIINNLIVKPIHGDVFKWDLSHMNEHGNMAIYPFGKKTGVGSKFLICLNKGLEKGKVYRLSIMLDEHYSVKRNSVDDLNRFEPLSKIRITYFDGENDVDIIAEDGTLGMIQSGEIVFSIQSDMVCSSEEGIEGYFIKITLVMDSLDVTPAILKISFNDIALIQKDTTAVFLEIKDTEFWKKDNIKIDYYSWNEINGCYIDSDEETADAAAIYEQDFYNNRILAIGNGLPNQCYNIPKKEVMADYFEILVSSVKDKGFFRKWIQVEDFDSSGPDDCHYIVDEKNGLVRFGNGIRGRMPEAEIRIISCAFSAGDAGNIKSGQNIKSPSLPENIYSYSIYDSTGGLEPEKLEDGFLRAREAFFKDERAVSQKDYENIIKKTPGLRIMDCKVLDSSEFSDMRYKNEVRIVVRPYSEEGNGTLSDVYQKNILNHIMEKRLIGTSIRLYSPIYIEIEVYTELRIKPHYINFEKKIQSVVEEFFSKLDGFGPVVNYGALFACIDGLEEVAEIYMLYIDARGGRVSRNKNGDVLLPSLGVLLLKKVNCIVIR